MREKLFKLIKRYRMFLLLLVGYIVLLVFFPETGVKSLLLTWDNLLEMLSVMPAIFILLGLLDVWVKRETMVKYMGEGSGFIGVLLAYLMGAVAAGPLYAAFPVAIVLIKKGSKLSNALVMLGAWSTMKIPLLMFEASSLGVRFMLIRLVMDIVGVAVIALVTDKALSVAQRDGIYENIQKLG
ncbi:MAG: permease [Eubacteriales bacterium]